MHASRAETPILLLGGTAEARELARALDMHGHSVLSTLAGRVEHPALPPGRVRVGGFGGVHGLAEVIRAERVRAVVDATHPFAAQISTHAAAAAARTGTPLLRLQRPGWHDHPLAPTWSWVPHLAAACDAARRYARPFLTTGRSTLSAFAALTDRDVMVRLVDSPGKPLPPRWRLVLSRGPYSSAGERSLMRAQRTDLLVTKDSGGAYTSAKLEAAADLGVPVVVLARPPAGPAVAEVSTVAEAVRWCALHYDGLLG